MEKKSQVWVETMVYTLIGLTIIAIVLSAATPQIQKMKERASLKQTIEALNSLNSKISEIKQNPGNIRIIFFKLSSGRLEINAENNILEYTLENTRLELSEVGVPIKEGHIDILTENYGKRFNIILTLNYADNLDITNNGEKGLKTLQAGTKPYSIKIENIGESEGKTQINFEIS